jgi:hypothetical protein
MGAVPTPAGEVVKSKNAVSNDNIDKTESTVQLTDGAEKEAGQRKGTVSTKAKKTTKARAKKQGVKKSTSTRARKSSQKQSDADIEKQD